MPKTNNTKIVTPPTQKSATLATSEFIDLQKAHPVWRWHIQDLALLGVFAIDSQTTPEFQPDQIITRREYARWLVNANNTMYSNNPAKQIRLASPSTQPAFRDILSQDA
ncbi:MAG: S-layer homology domain-containing protein, partial [Dolichospermum sp.]